MDIEYKRYGAFNSGVITNKVSGIVTIEKEVNQSQTEEAISQNLILLSRSANPNYNLYKFKSCGHTQFLQPTHVRRGNFKCNTCFHHDIVSEASCKSFFFLHYESRSYSKYLKPCGHVVSLTRQNLSSSLGKICDECFTQSVYRAAAESGLKIIHRGDNGRYLVEIEECGHIRSVLHPQIFRRNVECPTCKELNYKSEAEQNGLIYNGLCSAGVEGRENKRNYILPCGHSRDLRMSHVRDNRWQCDICEDSHLNKPSFVYLLRITTPVNSFLKLGYARDVSTRAQCYGLVNSTIDFISSIRFETGKDAQAFEKSLHRKYRVYSIEKGLISEFMKNGKTECYPLNLENELLSELRKAVLRND